MFSANVYGGSKQLNALDAIRTTLAEYWYDYLSFAATLKLTHYTVPVVMS